MKRRDFAHSFRRRRLFGEPAPCRAGAKRKDTRASLGMTLEPPGLDPTQGAGRGDGEIVLYNIFETLTKINVDGTVTPLLAESWDVSPDLQDLHLQAAQGRQVPERRALRRRDGEVLASSAPRARRAPTRTRRTFTNIERVAAIDEHTVVVINKELDPNFLFLHGPDHRRHRRAQERGHQRHQAGRHRPVQARRLEQGLVGHAGQVGRITAMPQPSRSNKVTFRFISDPAAQVAALLSGDIDAFPRVDAARSLAQFKNDPALQVVVSGSRAKTILAINNKKKPLDDVRVRRAIAAAIDRKAVIDGAVDGFGTPIGSHYVPGDAGYRRHHRHQPLRPGQGQGAAGGGRRQDAAGTHPDRCRRRPTRARAAR